MSIPDHDFVVAKQHKLIPSVYAAVKILPDAMGKPEAVGYIGPTYVANRSVKHCSCAAISHGFAYTTRRITVNRGQLDHFKTTFAVNLSTNSNIVKRMSEKSVLVTT